MAKKRQSKSKRSLSSLPKGLPQRKKTASSNNGNFADINPFEITSRQKRPKHEVHNRTISKPKSKQQTLESLQGRRTQLKSTMQQSHNSFIDRRIGQYDTAMTKEDRMLARVVRERMRRSKRHTKYQLDDAMELTHKGRPLLQHADDLAEDDDEDPKDKGYLAAIDTELHFGGFQTKPADVNPYGSAGMMSTDLSNVYSQRKTELDDIVARRKMRKLEKSQNKETQIDVVEKMDEQFAELSELLQYRDNANLKQENALFQQEHEEMMDWGREMNAMMTKPKRKATDRTKTPEEIAKDEAERLQELETKRLARMNGDFQDDDLSDISVNEVRKRRKKKERRQASGNARNPDELSDSEDDDDDGADKLEARFTADGLVYVNRNGEVVKTLAEERKSTKTNIYGSDDDNDDAIGDLGKGRTDAQDSGSDDDDDDDDSASDSVSNVKHPLAAGVRVKANYHADEQFDGHKAWYDGTIAHVHIQKDGSVLYDVDYEDGDFENGIKPHHIKLREATQDEKLNEDATKLKLEVLQMKQRKAKEQARSSMPFVFEAPTTLDALHDLIGRYAETGEDASTIIQRIHAANSVRLDHRNTEKMQNYYDVLLRRFIAVGDAICEHGNGGEELARYQQLDAITKVMYDMAQDAPESAGAVWNRRLGIFQNAHAKRLRDAEFIRKTENEELTAWPSTGSIFLLRAMGHIFPVTDLRHHVVTPAILLLGHMVSHTPILSLYDLVMGIMCAGLQLEYTKQAKRVPTEALAFLVSVLRLFAKNPGNLSVPSLNVAKGLPSFQKLSLRLSRWTKENQKDATTVPKLSLERSKIIANDDDTMWVAVFVTSLDLMQQTIATLGNALALDSIQELFSEASETILLMTKTKLVAGPVRQRLETLATAIAQHCRSQRAPLMRRPGATFQDTIIKSLAPRMEDPTRYSMSKDKGKKAIQIAIDRTRREFKREHKAISRELRMDAAFIESERRSETNKRDARAKAKRNKNYSWLEGEQAAMNQQVREGGGLLTGGGTGVARAKAKTGQMGIKKGGKMR